MFRLFKAELKKIFMKPSIFIVTGLIILMLALSFFIFHPDDKKDYLDTYAPATPSSTIEYCYSTIFNNESSNELKNREAISYINQAEREIDFYIDYDVETTGLVELKAQWKEIQNAFNEFVEIARPTVSNDTERNELLNKINAFSAKFNSYTTDSLYTYFFIKYSTQSNIVKYVSELQSIYAKLNTLTPTQAGDKDAFIIKQFNLTKIITTKKNSGHMDAELSYISSFQPNKNDLANLKTYINTAKTRLIAQRDKIVTYYNESDKTSRNTGIIRKSITNYKLTAKYAYDIVNSGVIIYGVPGYMEMSLQNYYGFADVNYSKTKIVFSQTSYMFDNEMYEYDYATPFSLFQPSNQSMNGYDYSYFALRLCSLFITIYLVVLAAGTIAGEQSAGTLKLIAIRPFKRSKLLLGKSLAIFAIGAILLGVSAIATMVIGAVTYGINSASIMVVFNGTNVFITSAFGLYFLAFVTMYIEILFYTSLSIFISTAFKSNVGAVSISTLAFFVSLVCNGMLTSVPLIGFLPFTNISFFKYFSSAFVITDAQSALFSILSPGVFVGSTFWSSLVIYLLTVSVLVYIPHLIFKNRDLR